MISESLVKQALRRRPTRALWQLRGEVITSNPAIGSADARTASGRSLLNAGRRIVTLIGLANRLSATDTKPHGLGHAYAIRESLLAENPLACSYRRGVALNHWLYDVATREFVP